MKLEAFWSVHYANLYYTSMTGINLTMWPLWKFFVIKPIAELSTLFSLIPHRPDAAQEKICWSLQRYPQITFSPNTSTHSHINTWKLCSIRNQSEKSCKSLPQMRYMHPCRITIAIVCVAYWLVGMYLRVQRSILSQSLESSSVHGHVCNQNPLWRNHKHILYMPARIYLQCFTHTFGKRERKQKNSIINKWLEGNVNRSKVMLQLDWRAPAMLRSLVWFMYTHTYVFLVFSYICISLYEICVCVCV